MFTLLRHRFDAMGTGCSVAVTTPVWAGSRARLAVTAALAEVAAQERSLSRFDLASDLTALNAAAGNWQPVSERLSPRSPPQCKRAARPAGVTTRPSCRP